MAGESMAGESFASTLVPGANPKINTAISATAFLEYKPFLIETSFNLSPLLPQ
jgi:hypothetical protein